ncbi:MAG: flagellar biosynthetic protein FliO [Oscillospiraceae bacterium]|nr:flagellar biosynthetic protein FliO [Oscillospiraceae bacterium]
MIGEVFTVICALLGVIGLLFLTFYAYKWLNKHRMSGGFGYNNRSIKIVEYVSIAQDKQLMIVTVGSKKMLLGVTPNAVTKVCDLDDEDIAVCESESEGEESGFMNSLKKAFAERNKASAETLENKEDGRNEKNDF